MSPHWSLSLRFPHQDPIHPPLLTHTHHMPSPSHSSRFYHLHNIGEEYKSFSPSLCNLLHSPVTSSFLGPNILLNTMFSNILSFYVLVIVLILQSCKPVCNLNLILFPNPGSFSFLKFNLCLSNLCAACLPIANLFLTFAITR